ncbi:Fur family transcriptional regulator [Jonesia denitrificans]|uniref:Ferric uptake regulator, Fur family n=1 Tax=Jonesia denitrificans (strain ATCC 14870 / DSM 20603 / BCRC 15368 / CIP 55.134 / JCM 11481 / NBRC 15587 / NCTC 10816 / Prevot 55134) TaxID=471856 RepID=C7R3Q1_JONDD|nr:Fur family transcriptional regulator [Jonesia denitrificans]ACV08758.1 ferric uptake regulator, Fur family [Jonesia denitrificans DSM 20603]ASE09918.1 transcriptional repressor [Jonesia denitrificans]QXB42255.1 transcriptional repressor [Jonesia denitrificans]SQH20747.1 Peroxide-responsive repressor perR [Jonesia denitrificans]
MDTSFEELLRSAGLRVTATRLAVLDAVSHHPHADSDTVLTAVRQALGTASVQTIYDALNTFAAHGLMNRIEPAGHPARFELRVGDNHHHMVCRACGDVQDIDCTIGQAPCLIPHTNHGYTVDEAEVTFWGRCPQCQTRTT